MRRFSSARRCNCFTATEGVLHELHAELRVRDSRRRQRARQAGIGVEVGIGVYFEDIGTVARPDAKIDAGVIAAAEEAEGLAGKDLELFAQARPDLGGVTGRGADALGK